MFVFSLVTFTAEAKLVPFKSVNGTVHIYPQITQDDLGFEEASYFDDVIRSCNRTSQCYYKYLQSILATDTMSEKSVKVDKLTKCCNEAIRDEHQLAFSVANGTVVHGVGAGICSAIVGVGKPNDNETRYIPFNGIVLNVPTDAYFKRCAEVAQYNTEYTFSPDGGINVFVYPTHTSYFPSNIGPVNKSLDVLTGSNAPGNPRDKNLLAVQVFPFLSIPIDGKVIVHIIVGPTGNPYVADCEDRLVPGLEDSLASGTLYFPTNINIGVLPGKRSATDTSYYKDNVYYVTNVGLQRCSSGETPTSVASTVLSQIN